MNTVRIDLVRMETEIFSVVLRSRFFLPKSRTAEGYIFLKEGGIIKNDMKKDLKQELFNGK